MHSFNRASAARADLDGNDIRINGMIPGPSKTELTDGVLPPDIPAGLLARHLRRPDQSYATVKKLLTLPSGGANGMVFFDEKQIDLYRNPMWQRLWFALMKMLSR